MINFFSKKNESVKKSLEDSQNLESFDTNKDVLLDEKLNKSKMRYRRLIETAVGQQVNTG